MPRPPARRVRGAAALLHGNRLDQRSRRRCRRARRAGRDDGRRGGADGRARAARARVVLAAGCRAVRLDHHPARVAGAVADAGRRRRGRRRHPHARPGCRSRSSGRTTSSPSAAPASRRAASLPASWPKRRRARRRAARGPRHRHQHRPAAYPPELSDRARSIETELGRPVDAGAVLAEMLVGAEPRARRDRARGPASLFTRWLELAPSAYGDAHRMGRPARRPDRRERGARRGRRAAGAHSRRRRAHHRR